MIANGIRTSIRVLKSYAKTVDDEEPPVLDNPLQDRISGYLDDTYKEAIQDCITILEKVLDSDPRER